MTDDRYQSHHPREMIVDVCIAWGHNSGLAVQCSTP